MSRLDFAPPLEEIRVTDVKKGLAVFTPKPGKAASLAALQGALKKAGYTLATADVRVAGRVERDAGGWWLVSEPSGQRFSLRPAGRGALPDAIAEGASLEVSGTWTTSAGAGGAVEAIAVVAAEPAGPPAPVPAAALLAPAASLSAYALALAPIRTTSPGLTVYRGGAVSAHHSYTHQHLGGLEVARRGVDLAASYTPTPRVQLAATLPIHHMRYEDGGPGGGSGAGGGLGNVTLWGKYRFFRALETWGDRQASARLGLELPTGSAAAPSRRALARPRFVREQLSAVDGGLALHADVAYSQAHGRLVLGGNAEAVARSARDGFRLGHELRVNSDLEVVAFPFRYERPGREVFALLETSLVVRGDGRSGGLEAPGSRSSEYFVAPGLQYVAGPRLSVEASWLVPVWRDAGPLALRTDRGLLVGVRCLF